MRATPLLLLFFLCTSLPLFSQPPTISFSTVVSGLTAPVDIVNAGDGSNRLFIVQQGGVIRIWNGTILTTFLNVGSTGLNLISTGGEQGLLSMAFHPDYDGTTNRQFFIYYTDINSDLALRRFQTVSGNPNAVESGSGTLLLTIPHPGQTNHNGGKLNFGSDGYLYFATGDGGGGNDPNNNAQNGFSLLGKMLRIDVNSTSPYGNYAVPADNLYACDPYVDPRIWAVGLRNPFRWSFDRQNGNMWIGDVGQDAREEVDFVAAGTTSKVNFGWRCFEGDIPSANPCTVPNYVPPVYAYAHGSGAQSVTGGYVYRGTEFTNFRGYYIAADIYTGNMYLLWPNGSGGFNNSVQTAVRTGIVAFGEAEDGTLYAVSQFNNPSPALLKVVATGGTALPGRIGSFRAVRRSGANELAWSMLTEQEVERYKIEYSLNGIDFSAAGEVAPSSAAGGRYTFLHAFSAATTVYYRLVMEGSGGRKRYSEVLRLEGEGGRTYAVYPTSITNGQLFLSARRPVQKLALLNGSGATVWEQNLGGFTGVQSLNLPSLARGVYMAVVWGSDGSRQTEKVMVE